MTAPGSISLDRPGVSAIDLLPMAQNPKAPAEVLEKILEHPALSPEVVLALLRHPSTPGAGMARLAEAATEDLLQVLLSNLERVNRWVEALEALLRNPAVPEIKHESIKRHIAIAKKRDAEGTKKGLLLRVKELPVGQKLALAKKGNKDVRMILIKDANEMVALEVVGSPRITDGEILAIAMMRDVSEKVLRFIANNRKYRQNRQMVLALVNNPRTPVSVSLGLGIQQFTDKELDELAKNRNVPGVISRAAKQVMDRRRAPKAAAGGGH